MDKIDFMEAAAYIRRFNITRYFILSIALTSTCPTVYGARPNILFLIGDDISAERFGSYGDEQALTPEIDKLASEGILFERAYAAGTVCLPSRKSFLTGLNVQTVGHGTNNYMQQHPETMTMPRWFREHGYQTAKVGKVAHGDEHEGPLDWDLNYNLTHSWPGGNAGKVVLRLADSSGKVLSTLHIRRDDQYSIDQWRTEMFEEFLTSGWDREKPFFFALGFHGGHQVNDANRRYLDMHDTSLIELSAPPPGATPMTKGYSSTYEYWSSDFPPENQRMAIQGYYAAVTLVDESVGKALGYLEKAGIAENTIIVFTTDQGLHLGYRDNWRKHILYPSILQVPLLFKFPGMKHRGAHAQGLVELMDIFPTLTELTGLPSPENIHGISFVPLLNSPEREWRPSIYAEGIMHGGKTVITKEGAYMEWDNGDLREYYDLFRDPMAWFNRVDSEEYSVAVENHQNLLKNPELFVPAPTTDKDDIAVDFGIDTGFWARMNDASWLKLHRTLSPNVVATGDMDGNGQDEVIADFTSTVGGIYVKRNLGGWMFLHGGSSESLTAGDLDNNGKDDVLVDFGAATGFWARMNDATWVKLHPTLSPDVVATGDLDGNGADDVLASFGSTVGGLWAKLNLGGWTQQNPNSPDDVVTGDMDGSGQDDIIADFSSTVGGVWVKRNQTTWVKLHNASPQAL